MNAAGGKASLDDLQRYRAEWSEPATARFQGHEIRVSPVTTGGQSLLASLALIEHTGLVNEAGNETVKVVLELLGHGGDLSSVLAAPPLLLAAARPQAGGALEQVLHVPAGAYSTGLLMALYAQGILVRECDVPEVLALKGTPTVVQLRDGVAEAGDVPGGSASRWWPDRTRTSVGVMRPRRNARVQV